MKKKGEYRIRVTYADTDAMGVVYYANYLKWFETGRSELMRDMGIVYSELETAGYYLPVIEAHCHYLLPARYDEVVLIETEITAIRRASVRFDYVIRDENKERILAAGFTLHPFTSKEGKIVRAPKHVSDKITGEQ